MYAASKEFRSTVPNTKGVETASRQALASEKTVRQEAQKIAFAVGDFIVLSSHPQAKFLYQTLLPATKGRLQVASEVLASPYVSNEVRDTVAFPLQKVLDPLISGRPWYARLAITQQLAQQHPTLLRSYYTYEFTQEYAQRKKLNAHRMDFIEGFLTSYTDVPLLQQRLQEVHYMGNNQPVDYWIREDLAMLSQLPVADLKLIADHPVGKRLLQIYEQFDRVFSHTRYRHMV